MRRNLIVGLLLLSGLFLVTEAFADAPKARTADETNYVVGVSHITSGNTMIVDSEGRAYVREMGGHTISTGYGDRSVYSGECVVHRVIVQVTEDPDGYAAVYDATSATGTPDLDPEPGVSNTTGMATVDLGGALFSTGIYVATDSSKGGGNILTTVVYDAL